MHVIVIFKNGLCLVYKRQSKIKTFFHPFKQYLKWLSFAWPLKAVILYPFESQWLPQNVKDQEHFLIIAFKME